MSSVESPTRDLDAAMAGAAGGANLAHAELTRLAAEALATDSWTGTSPTYWLVHTTGTTTARAATILAVAERRHLFPTVIGRFDAGELSLEQVAELVKAPPCADADIEHWGTIATPARIRRSIKRRYPPQPVADPTDDAPAADVEEVPTPIDVPADHDRLSTGITDDHRWRLTGEFDLETGQLIENALLRARKDLWERGQRTISQADCLREIIERFHDGIDSPLRRDRAKVWLHLDAASADALTPAGIRIPDSVRDKICCDGIIQPVWERDGVPFNLGRARHIVPERTRRIVLLRDQGCRVPGCHHDRIIDIHHIIHWIDGGPTDTWNLVALCPRHHRLHHQGKLGINGNADDPDGLVFTDVHGRRLEPTRAPTPPTEIPRPTNGYQPPLRGRVDWNYVGLSWPDPPDT